MLREGEAVNWTETLTSQSCRIPQGTSGEISGGYHTHRPRGPSEFCLLSNAPTLRGVGGEFPPYASYSYAKVTSNGAQHRGESVSKEFLRWATTTQPLANAGGQGGVVPPRALCSSRGGPFHSVSRIAKILSAKVRRSPPYYHHIAGVKALLFPVCGGCGI